LTDGKIAMKHLHGYAAPAQTEGALIRWTRLYDLITNILTFGQVKVFRNLTIELTLLEPGESILDIGCGTGGVTIPAKQCIGPGGKAVGIDPSPGMIAVALKKAHRTNLEIDFRVAVVEALPFPDASFDVVTASLVMHHLPGRLRVQAAAEIYRVLKPGGRLLVADLIRPKSSAGLGAFLIVLLHHGWPFDGEDLRILLMGAGFLEAVQLNRRFSAVGFIRATKGDFPAGDSNAV
jgi:demethylmenaquinone methyltransferase/2-methoxy-6-polyprenyl-1,4-benzoquinol methylase/phosphoethanolamine N-methyltransferase